MALAVEPKNPLQLSLFEWINGQAIAYSESPYRDSHRSISNPLDKTYSNLLKQVKKT
jgi:hypothetical protein